MTTKIEYNGSIVAIVEGGNTATLPIKDMKMKSDIVITVPKEASSEVVEEWDGSYSIEHAEEDKLLAPTVSTNTNIGAGLTITDNNPEGVTVSYNMYRASTGALDRTITRTAAVQEQGMADGSYKMIEEIVAGDKVQSYNIETGEYCEGTVTEVITGYTTRIAMVLFADSNYVAMAESHPLYTEDGWHSITNKDGYPTLVVGDKVLGINGYVEIEQLQVVDAEPTMVYSLSVSVGETAGVYFAGAGVMALHV